MSEKKEYSPKLPYTVVGHTGLPMPELSITLTAEGIKTLARKTKKGDMVRITEWADTKRDKYGHFVRKNYQTIKIIKK